MNNIEKHNEKINELETEWAYQMIDLEEEKNEYMLYKFDLIRSILATVLLLAFFALVLFVFIYPPIQRVIGRFVSIDFSNFPRFDLFDTMVIVGTYLIIVAIEALFVSWGLDDEYQFAFWLSLFPPIGLVNLIQAIFLAAGWRSATRAKIRNRNQEIRILEEGIAQEKIKQQAALKTIEKSHTVFEQGQAEDNVKMIQQAADMGNQAAITHINMLQQEREKRKADQYYEQAHASKPVDQQLLEKAARMGHARAAIVLAEQLFVKVNSSLYTQNEKKELRKQANDYLDKADFTNEPDGEILCVLAQLDSQNDVDYCELLNKVRTVKDAGNLSPRYDQLAESIIRRLVKEVDG